MFGGNSHEYQFSIELALALSEGFGYSNFDIVSRRLTTELRAFYEPVKDNILSAASNIAWKFNMSFTHEAAKSGNLDKATLSYQAPRYHFNREDGADPKDPMIPIEEMIEPFAKVAAGIKSMLVNDHNEKEASKSARYQKTLEQLAKEIESRGLKVPEKA
jgi:hypothetical protein